MSQKIVIDMHVQTFHYTILMDNTVYIYHFEMSPKTQSFKHKLSQKLTITIFSLRNHFMIYGIYYIILYTVFICSVSFRRISPLDF